MNNIITTQKSQTLTSMEVAEMVGKEHYHLIRDIRRYLKQLNEARFGLVDFFITFLYTSVPRVT